MLDETTKTTFSPLKSELYHAYQSAWCFKRKIESLPGRLQTETREFLLEELTSLRSLANDIVLRLCNLDDEKSRFSFQEIKRLLNKSAQLDQAAKKRLTDTVAEYRTSINTLKTQHRNKYIAHLQGDFYPDPFQVQEMVSGISIALASAQKTISTVWGAEQHFGFKLGSRDRTIDFVQEIKNEPI